MTAEVTGRRRAPRLRRLAGAATPGDRAGRAWLAIALLALGWVGWGALGGPAVGGFRDSAGMSRYLASYAEAMRDLPAAQRTLDLRTEYGVVRVYRFQGPDDERAPLLLLPGTQSGTPVWADNLPGLLKHRSVYALDLLGEPGMSVQARPIDDDGDKAAWLHQVLEQLPEPELHVVGLSIGGWTATNLAARHPGKVATLTLVEPVMVFTGLRVEAIVRSIPASVPWLPRSWRDGFASWTAGGAPVEDIPVARMIEAGMQSYRMAQPGLSRMTTGDLERVRVPTLVIVADESPMHDPDDLAAGAQQLPDVRVLVYPNTSHAINGEEAERLATDIGSFVDAHG
ncbi:MAG: alpha/beta fold hydrolase [Phycicoccus sp.]